MPMFFSSNALYPLAYQVDALRHLMIAHAPTAFGLVHDFAVQGSAPAALAVVAARLYPRIVD